MIWVDRFKEEEKIIDKIIRLPTIILEINIRRKIVYEVNVGIWD